MQENMTGKTVIITGAGGAIGGAMAENFAKNGANVVIADLNEQTMMAKVEQLKEAGGRAFGVKTDVTDRDSTENMIAKTVETFGSVDVMINNAGINGGPQYRQPIHEYNDDLWHKILSVDLDGVYYCSKAAVRQMEKQGRGGSIVNIASIVGITPLRLQVAFTAAKAGVINMTKSMAIELAPLGIRVNCICPGSIMFELTRQLFYADKEKANALISHIPLNRPGEPDDIAGTALFLASSAAAYVTGTVIPVDGGWTCGYNRKY